MWFLRRPGASVLDELLARLRDAPLSYPERGMSLGEVSVPTHYHCERHRVALDVDFDAAKAALAAFATHRLHYMFLHPEAPSVRLGLDVIVCARIGPVWTANPCRVVAVNESPDRFAYAYGTLPGHSEHGEESFAVERVREGGVLRVYGETVAYARPQDILARLGEPIAHRVQASIKVDYMAALVAAVSRHAAR